MKTQRISHSFLARLFIALAAALLGGCACGGHGSCGPDPCAEMCYAAWPCFGYHSTCWRPWPEECVTCPSPYSHLPAEAIQSPPPTGDLPMSPTPMPPLPEQPQPPQLPMPPADANRPPMPAAPSELQGQNPQGESSSRRRSLEGQYSLDGLRWAPTSSP